MRAADYSATVSGSQLQGNSAQNGAAFYLDAGGLNVATSTFSGSVASVAGPLLVSTAGTTFTRLSAGTSEL